MFSIYCYCGSRLTIELDPTRSREFMTANRDALKSEYNSYLVQLTLDARMKTSRTLQPEHKKKKYKTNGDMIVSRRESGSKVVENVVGFGIQNLVDATKILKVGPRGGGGTSEEVKNIQLYHGTYPITMLVEGPEFNDHVHIWNPVNWTWSIMSDNSIRINYGKYSLAVLRAWLECCREAVNCLLRVENIIDEVQWSIGWYFGDDKAVHEGDRDLHFFLVRPIHPDGSNIFDLGSWRGTKALMSAAKHEVAHVMSSYHDETFASTMTYIDEKYDEIEVWRRISGMVSEMGASSPVLAEGRAPETG